MESQKRRRYVAELKLLSDGRPRFVANGEPKSCRKSYPLENNRALFATRELVFPSEGRICVDSQPSTFCLGSAPPGISAVLCCSRALHHITKARPKSLLWSSIWLLVRLGRSQYCPRR